MAIIHPEANASYTQRNSSLYYGKNSEYGVKTKQYTYAIDSDGKLLALFDNIADPYQLKPLSLADIPVEDSTFLKSELGTWLKHINHSWYQQKRYPKMVHYP